MRHNYRHHGILVECAERGHRETGRLKFNTWVEEIIFFLSQITQWEALKSECWFVLKMQTAKPVYAPDNSLSMASSLSLKSLERDDSGPIHEVISQRNLHSI